jgi:hypothetical protein
MKVCDFMSPEVQLCTPDAHEGLPARCAMTTYWRPFFLRQGREAWTAWLAGGRPIARRRSLTERAKVTQT